LVGGLEPWNLIRLSILIGNSIIPTDELHHFSEGWVYHQPDINGIQVNALSINIIRRWEYTNA
jgi:hypothetical protein